MKCDYCDREARWGLYREGVPVITFSHYCDLHLADKARKVARIAARKERDDG